MTKSEALAETVVTECLRRGVREFVLCAGSRNSPLTLSVLRMEVPHWTFFEERSAGFFALGRARALGAPVAVVTTSGTAVAELYPAMVEALYERVPLLAMTADRPKRFRGSGAPQSIEQSGLFCLYAVAGWDIDEEDEDLDMSGWDWDGPAHLNLCLDDPLLSEEALGPPVSSWNRETLPPPERKPVRRRARMAAPDVVLLGALRREERQEVRSFLLGLGAPVLADATSGLREDAALRPWMVRGGERVLPSVPIRTVLRIGGVPSCRFWRDLENRMEIGVYSVLTGGFRGLARHSVPFARLEDIEVEGVSEAGWLERDRERADELEALLERHPRSEVGVVRELSESFEAGATVFLGNSLPIREWNLGATFQGRGYEVWGNRGANGIDGNLSTFLGLGAGGGTACAVVGDLTALYDLAAPWVLPQLAPAKRVIVVLNNGGGRIFSRLPILGKVTEAVRATTETTHGTGFAEWAAMWGMRYARSIDEVEGEGTWVVEIRPDAEETGAFWESFERLAE